MMTVAMKRRWNWMLWAGFAVALAGLFSYPLLLIDFPVTRDFPWVNLVLFAAAFVLLGIGLSRAFRQPAVYRGRVFGSLLTLLSVAGVGMFCYGLLYVARQLPSSAGAPRVGQKVPDFILPDQDGKPVALAELLNTSSTAPATQTTTVPPGNGALLIFYRGYW